MATNTTTPESIAEQSPYSYVPTLSVGIILLSLFALTTGQAIYLKLWWMFPTVITGGIGEILGWTTRVWSSKAPLAENSFLMQITTTIISPTFILAANLVVVGQLIDRFGPRYKPRMYPIVFCTCDVAALVIQAVGGAKASLAVNQNDLAGSDKGGNIMLCGVCFQLAAITLYSVLAIEFILRYLHNRPFPGRQDTAGAVTSVLGPHIKLILAGLSLSSICIFIRAIYRTIELSDGWTGRIISSGKYFVILDGSIVFTAMVALNVFHPGALMRQDLSETENLSETEKEITVEEDGFWYAI